MLLAQIAQTAFYFISEHYLIIIISLLIIFLILRSQDNERRGILFALFFLVLIGYLFYWRSLCRNQENIEENTIITYKELTTPQLAILNEKFEIYKKCETNDTLILWKLKGSEVFPDLEGSDGLADGGDGKVKGGGGGNGTNDVEVSRNLRIFIPEPTNNSFSLNAPPKDTIIRRTSSYLIANTDTGIENALLVSNNIYPFFNNLWFKDRNTSFNELPANFNALKNSERGWNFVDNNNNIIQNNSHGTNTTFLFERELTETPHKFIPLVVLNKDNNGFLFDALCAFEYAIAFNKYSKSDSIRVINASWGYYGFENAALKHVIDKLKKNNILLVAAAGNSNAECDKCEKLEKNNLRNLSVRRKKFYPASYSNVCDNLVSVTTVNVNGDIFQSENQNYSDEYVDLGVQSDNYRTGDFLFKLPNMPISTLNWGTSYATPIATAEIFNRKLLKPQTVQTDGSVRYVLDTKNILLTKDVVGADQEQATSNYRIESTWRATNLTKNGKVLLKRY